MANVISYAEQFEPYILALYATELKTDKLSKSNPRVQWLNAKTIQIPEVTMSGYKDHNRNGGGFNTGDIKTKYVAYTLEFDRDIEHTIDSMDVPESNLTKYFANFHADFEKREAIPEKDRYRLSKMYTEFVEYGGVVDTTTLTVSNVLDWFDNEMEVMDDKSVPSSGRLLFVTSHVNKLLKKAEGITRVLGVQDNNGKIDRKVYDLDDVEIIVVPGDRMMTEYDFTNGSVPAPGAGQINAILMHPDSVICRDRYQYIKVFTPGADSRTADSYVYQNRYYGDLFVIKSRLAGIAINASVSSPSA